MFRAHGRNWFSTIHGGRITGKEQYGEHDVCYVCISDMHLGEEDSLLTNIEGGNLETGKPSEVMVKLVECLKEIISKNEDKEKKPTLILNGDILEMALAQTNIAAMTFDRFLELIIKEGEELFERIIYIPGNHDHHIWELARESQYVKYINRHPNEELPFPWHKTPMCPQKPPQLTTEPNSQLSPEPKPRPNNQPDPQSDLKPYPQLDHQLESASSAPENQAHRDICCAEEKDKRIYSDFLNCLIKRHLDHKYKGIKLSDKIQIEVAYPNLGLFSDDGKKCVLFHHGHFVESIYRLMSLLKAGALGIDRDMPSDVQMLESENFAWIDFFWSMLGRSGDAGETTELIYEHLKNKKHARKLTDEFAQNLAEKFDLKIPIVSFFGDRTEEIVLRQLLRKYISDERASLSEKYLKGDALGEETKSGLCLYLQTSWNQIIEEHLGAVPSELTFVMGHTHKPFDMHIPREKAKIPGLDAGVDVYNTGGWIVDEAEFNREKGAAVFLLDSNLNPVSLYIYREPGKTETKEKKEAKTKKVTEAKREAETETKAVKGTKKIAETSSISRVEVESRKWMNNPFYEKIKSIVEENEKPWMEFSNLLDYELKQRKEEMKCRLQRL